MPHRRKLMHGTRARTLSATALTRATVWALPSASTSISSTATSNLAHSLPLSLARRLACAPRQLVLLIGFSNRLLDVRPAKLDRRPTDCRHEHIVAIVARSAVEAAREGGREAREASGRATVVEAAALQVGSITCTPTAADGGGEGGKVRPGYHKYDVVDAPAGRRDARTGSVAES
jgi:hypothetical protein